MGPRLFLAKSLKGDWDRKCFQDNKKFETVVYFSFAKFQLVLTGRHGDMVA